MDGILLENGDALLLENADALLLEGSVIEPTDFAFVLRLGPLKWSSAVSAKWQIGAPQL